MKLKVLGSSSSGNCYILENDSEALIIECGIKPKEVKKALGFNTTKVNGVIYSHIHQDHAKYIKDFKSMGYKYVDPMWDEECLLNTTFTFGKFKVKTFKLKHDVPCYGFFIYHPDIGSMIYATDTELIPFTFPGANHFLVEANYSIEDIQRDYDAFYHVLQGHQSIEACCEFLKRHDVDDTKNVIICHLSETNGNVEKFEQMASECFGNVKPTISTARVGMQIELIN